MNGQIVWSPGVKLDDIEKQVILKAYSHFGKNKTATANALGIAIRTLDNKLERYELDVKEQEQRSGRDKATREAQLARHRGIPSAAQAPIQQHNRSNGNEANARNGVEPVTNTSAKSSVSVPEPKEIQGVLPRKTASGGNGQRR